MSREETADKSRWPVCIAGGILAALLFLAVWVPSHPARPHLPTSDIYTHLSVARHLARGEGFRTDVTYPLSFAFPFARELPQPLIHRQPGFAVLLTAPYLAGGGYPERAVDKVRWMQIILLGILLALGGTYILRRGNRAAVLPWLMLLFFNPLLVFAVDWGMVELVCSVLLLGLWVRAREHAVGRPNWIDGLLAGALSMMRLDLFWVPLLWWILLRAHPLKPGTGDRRLGLLILAWLVVMTPWSVRNIQLTGHPFFSLQSYAEHVKDTRTWPGYSVYRQLEPQSFAGTMTSDPVPVLRKVGRGVKFYFREMPRLIPLPAVVGLLLGAFVFLGNRLRPKAAADTGKSGRPAALTVLTVVMLSCQYAFFDHSLRHLLVVLPVVMWEVAGWTGAISDRLVQNPGRRWGLERIRNMGILLGATATVAIIFLFPSRIPGWDSAAREAANKAPLTARQVDLVRGAGEGVLFAETSAVPWYLDRSIVWSPGNEETRSRICDLLELPDANPKENP